MKIRRRKRAPMRPLREELTDIPNLLTFARILTLPHGYLINAVTATEPRAFWIAELEKAGVPCGPILDYADALTTPQAMAREMTMQVEHPTLGQLRTLGTPIKMSETPLNPGRRAPLLGEHSDSILADAGYDPNEIEQLRYSGAVR